MSKIRIFAAACTVLLAAIVYALCPPPQGARAQFATQGAFVKTTSGSPNAQTLTIPNVGSYNDLLGVPVTLVSGFSANSGPMTLNVNSLGGVPLRRLVSNPGMGYVDLGPNHLIGGVATTVIYDGAQFTLATNNDLSAVGSTIEMRTITAPLGYLIEDGSCVSTTTYSALFAAIGNNFGTCSTGFFPVPNSKGTAFAAFDNQGAGGAAGRITLAGSGCNAVGFTFCGSQTATLGPLHIPPHTHNGGGVTSGVGPHLHFTAVNNTGGTSVLDPTTSVYVGGPTSGAYSDYILRGSAGNGAASVGPTSAAGGDAGRTYSFTTDGGAVGAQPLGGQPHSILNPLTFGIRAIKY